MKDKKFYQGYIVYISTFRVRTKHPGPASTADRHERAKKRATLVWLFLATICKNDGVQITPPGDKMPLKARA